MTTTTTLDTLTDDQIDALGREAAISGDVTMRLICDIANGMSARTLDALRRAVAMTQNEARAEVVRVIRDAEAQAE